MKRQKLQYSYVFIHPDKWTATLMAEERPVNNLFAEMLTPENVVKLAWHVKRLALLQGT
jgi:hypothetical protein